jgi:formylglycine-generating enzyme required for sulfatase activity
MKSRSAAMFLFIIMMALAGIPANLGKTEAGERISVTLPGDVSIEFMPIPAGTFMMGTSEAAVIFPTGAPVSGKMLENDEVQHRATLTKSFCLGIYEVTQKQWRAVMGTNPSRFKGDRRPMEKVSWDDAVEFCRGASELTGRKFRLPTEAEWEYACRAGTTSAYNTGNNFVQANFGTHEVGSYSPNAWGLYDMHGNVWEWCSDWYGDYPTGSVSDPQGPENGSRRVLRGGSWVNLPRFCSSSSRGRHDPGARFDDFGFRVVLDQ